MRRMAWGLGGLALGAVLVALAAGTVDARQQMSEADYDAVMKRVGPAFGGLRKALEASSAEPAAQSTAVLRQAFTEVEHFWKGRQRADAAEWAAAARKTVETIDAQARGGNWDAAKAAATDLQGYCQKCHGAYRDKAEDGSWRIRPGT